MADNKQGTSAFRYVAHFSQAFFLKLGVADGQYFVNQQYFRVKVRGNGNGIGADIQQNTAPAGALSRQSDADAACAHEAGLACIVMTADCLPVLFCDRAGTVVAAAHAGWRGLLGNEQGGVLEASIQAMGCNPADILAWLGPAIGPGAFEVGGEVRDAFMAQQAEAEAAFVPSSNEGKWLADIYLLARLRLARAGVGAVYGGEFCTFGDGERFYSYRRDGQTGRMASLVWLAK